MESGQYVVDWLGETRRHRRPPPVGPGGHCSHQCGRERPWSLDSWRHEHGNCARPRFHFRGLFRRKNSVNRARQPNARLEKSELNSLISLVEREADSLVFVGGCATGLLVTRIRANRIRATEDVDVIAEVATIAEYRGVESILVSRGFKHDTSPDAPICRWLGGGITLDLMPSQPGVLSFHNRSKHSKAAETVIFLRAMISRT